MRQRLSKRRFLVRNMPGIYHVMSRTAYKQFSIGPAEKEHFIRLLHKQAQFCGADVLAYCIMTNHFHVLVRIPSADDLEEMADTELIRRYSCLYSDRFCPPSSLTPSAVQRILHSGGEPAKELRMKIKKRMHRLPVFMQELKQRFTMWYNHTHSNVGTLWAERYRSVLVEDQSVARRTVSAYIELNPVRAGLVTEPSQYSWSSYGAAVGGDSAARGCICTLLGIDSWSDARAIYESALRDVDSATIETEAETSQPDFSSARFDPSGGRLHGSDIKRRRIPAFGTGRIIGTPAFIAKFYARRRCRELLIPLGISSTTVRPDALSVLCALRCPND